MNVFRMIEAMAVGGAVIWAVVQIGKAILRFIAWLGRDEETPRREAPVDRRTAGCRRSDERKWPRE